MPTEKNMISDTHFSELEQANKRLAQNWNILTKIRANGGLVETNLLIKAEMDYLQALQLVINAAESAVLEKKIR